MSRKYFEKVEFFGQEMQLWWGYWAFVEIVRIGNGQKRDNCVVLFGSRFGY